MRKLTKLLVLVLTLALLAGSIFAVASFAADDNDTGIEGATRQRIDFDGLVFDWHKRVIGSKAAEPVTEIGTNPFHDLISGKYGHIRTKR